MPTFLNVVTELRQVLRAFARRPGYAIAALVMLGLAVAANTTVFSVLYGFLWRPLPYPHASRLAAVREQLPAAGFTGPVVSVEGYVGLRRELHGVAAAGLATWTRTSPVRVGGETELLDYQAATPSLFRTLGVSPVLGRFPSAAAGRPGGPAEALISEALWQSAYGGNRSVLGKSLELNGKTYRIVGVMPRRFFFEQAGVGVWVPFVLTPARRRDGNINYWVVVRRKPGVSLARLNLELGRYQQQVLAREGPSQRARHLKGGFTIDARPLRSVLLRELNFETLPWLLEGTAALLLLLALANTVNLAVVRQRARHQQFAVRHVLGATRRDVQRLIALEHLPIAIAVAAISLVLAFAGISALHAFGLPPAGSPFHVTLALPVVVLCGLLSLCALMLVGLGPAMIADRQRGLSESGGSTVAGGGPGARRIQRGLGAVQVALACVLVISGGLLGMSLWRILSQPLGFDPHDRVVATIYLPGNIDRRSAWSAVRSGLAQTPGVDNVAATNLVPFAGGGNIQAGVAPLGVPSSGNIGANLRLVEPTFFATMHVGLLAGRVFSRADEASHARVVVVNAALARRFFGSAHAAIGQSLNLGGSRIIGVARNVTWQSTPDQYRAGTVYLPWSVPLSVGSNVIEAVVHTHGARSAVLASVRSAIRQGLPGTAVFRLSTFSSLLRRASALQSAGAGIVGAFATLTLLLAALGAYAITAFIARGRLGEYGIRAAVGAGPTALLQLGLAEALWLLGIGVPIGLGGAYVMGRAMEGFLFHTPAADAGVYLGGLGVIVAAVLVAAWRPAARAARISVRELLSEK